MAKLLDGKNAIVTGCNRGIGLATLKALCANGANVFAVVRKKDNDFLKTCCELEQQHHVRICVFYSDFEDELQVKRVAKEILAQKEVINILVNNIGISNSGSSLLMTRMEDIKKVFQVNYFSTILFTQQISKALIRNKNGSIVFISSMAVFDAWSNIEYTSSKSAIVGAVKRLAIELGPYGIRVNTVAPTVTDTDMASQMSEEDKSIVTSRNIMKRMGRPEEVADAIVFLASDMSSFITGQTLRVDGGLIG